ncbi:sugar kinase [Entomohabitans teleogrylli]|uniref:sugar kinase n=1 Tax=Entomohabitans teleogrylli TaxID=1384589 RepID=UPI00073D5AE6|nr:sugar kinase [Entomohabitans teleogrylli]
MNDREKQILKILRRNPLIQQHEIADILAISRSRVAAHIMDLMRKGLIKGKGYILAEQDYCVVLGSVNMDIRGVANIHYPQPASNPGCIRCSPGGVGRNIAHNLALLGRDCHLISAVGNDFYGENLLEQTRLAGVNIQSCVRLHGHSTATYLAIDNDAGETVVAINDTHIMAQLTPELLNPSRDLLSHSGVVVADCNLDEAALTWVFTHAREVPVFVDTVSEFKAARIRNWLARIHTLKMARQDAELLYGAAIGSEQEMRAAGEWFHRQGTARVCIYLDDHAVFCSERSGLQLRLAAPPYPIQDPFGADDAFMAGLVYSFLDGSDTRDSLVFAQACAALTRASASMNNPNLSVDNVLELLQSDASK